jgi:hypothetical protein
MKTVEKDNYQTLASYFERDGLPRDEITFTVNVQGVYSIPDEWIKLDNCGSTDLWSWQTKVSDIVVNDGKVNQRELSEEEKKELENKGKKKDPNAGKKKTDEQIREEQERLEKERLEKEEKDRKFNEEWNALDEQTQFYRTKEDPTKGPWITYPNGKNLQSIKKTGDELVELDEDINYNEGFFIEFGKVPPPDEDVKKRPKPKGISIDEVKPINCVCWIDLREFKNKPGLTEITQRSFLMLKDTYERRNKEADTVQLGTNVHSNIPYSNVNTQNSPFDIIKTESQIAKTEPNIVFKPELNTMTDYVMNKKTYIYLTISMDNSINPPVPSDLPKPETVVRREETPIRHITPDEICSDFRKQLKIAIQAISKEYLNNLGDTKGQLIKKDRNIPGVNQKNEERDNNIIKFLKGFNESGKAELLKEKIKRFVVLIVREKFNHKTNIRSTFKDDRDEFFSELYASLSDEIRLSMDEFVALKRDELHEHILTSYDQSRKDVFHYVAKMNREVILSLIL